MGMRSRCQYRNIHWYILTASAFLLVFGYYFLAALPLAHAAGMFVVRPAKIEIALPPGGEQIVVITAANETDSPLDVFVSFEDIEAKPQRDARDEPLLLLGEERGARSLKEFLSTPRASLMLLPGETAEIPVTVQIPRDAEPGGRYGSAVIRFAPPSGAAGAANVALESRAATALFVRVEGDVVEKGKLAAFGLFNDARYARRPSEQSPLRFHVAYENEGTVHLNPYGRLTLTPLFGEPRIISIDPWAVLPGATRMREVAVTEDLSVGPYAARLDLNRGYGDVVDEASVDFWILPGPWGWAWISIGIIAFVSLLWRSLRLSRNSVR